MLWLLLLLLLVILAVGAVPAYPYSRSWGYYPSGLLTLVLVVLLALILFGAIDVGLGGN